VSILLYVHDILTPVSLEVLSLQSLVEFTKSVAALHDENPALSMKYILPTFLDRRVKKSQEILEQLQAHYGPRLCPAVRYSVRLSEAAGYGQTIYEYAPNSPGAIDYQCVAEKIAEGETPKDA
jgi:chromosome partitioning protein